jgi:hypothetical protein
MFNLFQQIIATLGKCASEGAFRPDDSLATLAARVFRLVGFL